MGLRLVEEADQASCRRHREDHLGRQIAEREVVPLVHRGVKAQERSAVFTVGDLDKVGLVRGDLEVQFFFHIKQGLASAGTIRNEASTGFYYDLRFPYL